MENAPPEELSPYDRAEILCKALISQFPLCREDLLEKLEYGIGLSMVAHFAVRPGDTRTEKYFEEAQKSFMEVIGRVYPPEFVRAKAVGT